MASLKAVKGLNKKVASATDVTDTLGGGSPIPCGVHKAKIISNYLKEYDSGAMALHLEFKLLELDDRRFNTTLWVTGSDGKVTSEYNGKVSPKRGYLLADALALIATDMEAGLFDDLDEEEKVFEVREDGKDVKRKFTSLTELNGVVVLLGIVSRESYKRAKNEASGEYEDTDDIVTDTSIKAVFNEDEFTVSELSKELKEPEFITQFEDKYEGVTVIPMSEAQIKKHEKAKRSSGGSVRNASVGGKSRGNRRLLNR